MEAKQRGRDKILDEMESLFWTKMKQSGEREVEEERGKVEDDVNSSAKQRETLVITKSTSGSFLPPYFSVFSILPSLSSTACISFCHHMRFILEATQSSFLLQVLFGCRSSTFSLWKN